MIALMKFSKKKMKNQSIFVQNVLKLINVNQKAPFVKSQNLFLFLFIMKIKVMKNLKNFIINLKKKLIFLRVIILVRILNQKNIFYRQ